MWDDSYYWMDTQVFGRSVGCMLPVSLSIKSWLIEALKTDWQWPTNLSWTLVLNTVMLWCEFLTMLRKWQLKDKTANLCWGGSCDMVEFMMTILWWYWYVIAKIKFKIGKKTQRDPECSGSFFQYLVRLLFGYGYEVTKNRRNKGFMLPCVGCIPVSIFNDVLIYFNHFTVKKPSW